MADDDEQSVKKPPPTAKLHHIFMDHVNTMVGRSVLDKIGYPYEKNQDDFNTIVGTTLEGENDICVLADFIKKKYFFGAFL